MDNWHSAAVSLFWSIHVLESEQQLKQWDLTINKDGGGFLGSKYPRVILTDDDDASLKRLKGNNVLLPDDSFV